MSHLLLLVPKAGLEPARLGKRLILSQVRLPIPPLRHIPFCYPAHWQVRYRTDNMLTFSSYIVKRIYNNLQNLFC